MIFPANHQLLLSGSKVMEPNFDENLCDYNLMICPIGDSERSFYIDYNHLTLLGAEKLNIRFNEIFSK